MSNDSSNIPAAIPAGQATVIRPASDGADWRWAGPGESQNPAAGPGSPGQPDSLPPGVTMQVAVGQPPLAGLPVPGRGSIRGMARGSVVLGAAALLTDVALGAGIIFAIPAIIMGGVAVTRTQRGEQGRGLAIVALIIGCAAAAVAVFAFYAELSAVATACARDGGC
jgi:hypothetical protein